MSASIISLGEKTSDGTLHDGNTRLSAVMVITDGTNTATVILYDNTAASGKKVFEAQVDAGNDHSVLYTFPCPVRCENGLYLDIDGTGASCIVYTG